MIALGERRVQAPPEAPRQDQGVEEVMARIEKLIEIREPRYIPGHRYPHFQTKYPDHFEKRGRFERYFNPQDTQRTIEEVKLRNKRREVLERLGLARWDAILVEERVEEGEDRTVAYRKSPKNDLVYQVLDDQRVPHTIETVQVTEGLVVAPSEASLRQFLGLPPLA